MGKSVASFMERNYCIYPNEINNRPKAGFNERYERLG